MNDINNKISQDFMRLNDTSNVLSVMNDINDKCDFSFTNDINDSH